MLASSPPHSLRLIPGLRPIERLALFRLRRRPLVDRPFRSFDRFSFSRVAPVAHVRVRVPGFEVLPALAASLQVWCGVVWSAPARAVRVVRQREEKPGPAPAADLRIRTRGRHRSHVDRALLRWCAGWRVLIREGASERHDGISVLWRSRGRSRLALHRFWCAGRPRSYGQRRRGSHVPRIPGRRAPRSRDPSTRRRARRGCSPDAR